MLIIALNAKFTFLQQYSPSHEHVAPHDSWQTRQLGNYAEQENAE